MATQHPLYDVLAKCGDFVVKNKGEWDHDAWEAFVADAVKLGVSDTDEDKRSLGNILEASKAFYASLSCSCEKAPAKKAAAKPKAKAKAKPKAKAKA